MMKKTIFTAFLLIILTSCIAKIEKRGYMFDLVDYNLLEEGITTKERALKIMGFPTMTSNFNDNIWIYYSEEKKGFLFMRPNIVARDILVLKFDDSQVVKSVQKINLADENKDIKFATNYTQVETRKVSALKSIINNVGQIKSQ